MFFYSELEVGVAIARAYLHYFCVHYGNAKPCERGNGTENAECLNLMNQFCFHVNILCLLNA